MRISIVIIVKNGETTIDSTLQSLVDFDDVVVYDNGSTDNTLELVNKYKTALYNVWSCFFNCNG